MTASTDRTPAFDINVPKGTKVSKLVQVQSNGAVVALPVGTKAKMQIRTSTDSTVVKLELTTENGGIMVDEAQAQVQFTMTTAQTGAFDFPRGEYDLNLIYPDNEWERLVEGKIFVFPAVTQ